MATLTVGSGSSFEYSTLAAAIAASSDGDVIKVQAGTYTNDFATITTSITIEGVGGLVNLVATEPPPDLKGILTIGTPGGTGPTVTLYNMEFSGASIDNSDGGNGAGIRYQSGDLTLDHTYFHDNQEGLLADADPTGTITINNSEFYNNGNANPPGSGVEHNLYVGEIQSLTVDNSYFLNPIVGHDIKSRAATTTIENSRIDDPNGTGSYEIDLPSGGVGVIENNTIEKGTGAQNSNFIAYGEEGLAYSTNSLSVTGNTVLNDHGSATFVNNSTAIPVSVTGNTLYGLTSGQVASGPVSSPESNTFDSQSSEPALDTSAPYLPVLPFSFTCFAEGTRIRTTDGYVAVEALRPGQQAIVAGPEQGAARTRRIVWIGYRHIDLTRHPDPDLARPIRIAADAFADGEPRRDLLVSPDHAIFAGGLLVPARLLLNGATITRDSRPRKICYYHVELDRHDILLAEGLPVESYLDCGNRGAFENAGAPLVLHPDLSADRQQARREQFSCAPFAADAERVKPIWRTLAVRAWQLGHAIDTPSITKDPALRLLVDGRVLAPASRAGDRYSFTLPGGAHDVLLVSRATKPCDVAPWVEDRRRLGVAVERILLSHRAGVIEVPADASFPGDGWWDAECEGSKVWRWTDGKARLPVLPGVAAIEIHLTGETPYLVANETSGGWPANAAAVARKAS